SCNVLLSKLPCCLVANSNSSSSSSTPSCNGTKGQVDGADMPSGQRSQVWYPNVVEVLRREWHADLSWDDIVELRDKLQLELDRHQKLHGIVRATFRCPDCGAVG